MPDTGTDTRLTYGEELVGLLFNPSGNKDVQNLKEKAAAFVDAMYDVNVTHDSVAYHILERAKMDALSAQMFAVKAATMELK